jgi:RES domain-containing protein
MLLYRLTKYTYAHDLSGAGAKTYGGRWNSKGNAMLYFASSRALAVLEVLVHLSPLIVPDNYSIVTVEAPEDIETLIIEGLPKGWRSPGAISLKAIGDKFLAKNEHLLLQVPSSIVTEEFNYLINPLHNLATKLKVVDITPFSFDSRLLS